ncbi:hypothetical protein W97_08541 [Coniosporium apollinis CBS 100218]|uniref:R3H domain-containing protein n=1 Tax=Coniosporium apollinis (strain CBS 100218) TaxID=1168221 RepID=R7Z511_CONA1|nr:uncharacterized protein W97_08541 [Coniosporium apollinis CBS 100218]EON69183.1 hypothetical protein W97_08541 [Coniosporium apollinis CBS 100218]
MALNPSIFELCHRGPCGSCREAIFDEISCNCGRTVLQPPLPCGTQPPPCRFDCERSKACGHPQVPHNCHQDTEDCPRCPFLTVKPCMCGKNLLKNQQCWLTDVRCGEICGKKLKCGAHKCRKPCHKSGECEDAGRSCQQPCGKEKSCGHPCSDPCHSPYPCKEDKPCQHKIFITCDCQHIRQEAKCNATRDNEGNSTKSLKCDDECARLERNRRLALALNIDPETHKDDHIPYSSETLNMFLQNVPWAQTQEREFRVFASSPEEKRLRSKPMPPTQRAFLHSLAEDFGFDSESMDPEPHRHVALFKSPRFVTAPMKTLAECARIRHSQRAATANSAAVSEKKVKPSNVIGEPYNGFLLTNAKFGLTIEELRSAIRPALAATPSVQFDISFQPDESVVLKATPSAAVPSERDLEATLQSLKPGVSAAVKAQALGSIQLCRLDGSLNVLRRESDSASNGGWSQVAAKAAAPRMAIRQPVVQAKNAYTVLGAGKVQLGKKKEKKKEKLREESVVDDWEAAESAEEEREKVAGSVGSGDEMGGGRAGSVGSAAASGEEKEKNNGEAPVEAEEAA